MAWESRGARTYYYRSVKHGGCVTKVYMGKGPFVAMLVDEVEQERVQRQAKAEAWRQARQEMEALNAQISTWWNASSTLIDAILTAHGFYRHDRGPWRKRADHPGTPQTPAQGRAGE